MISAFAHGAAAGAIGTLALESVTYVDMILTGRPESQLPVQAAERITESLGMDFGEAAANRKRAIGALLGYANGVAVGAVYGAVAGRGRPTVLRGITLGRVAMLASNGPSTISGLTDPRQRGWRGWLEDLIPHLAYGLAAARVHGSLTAP